MPPRETTRNDETGRYERTIPLGPGYVRYIQSKRSESSYGRDRRRDRKKSPHELMRPSLKTKWLMDMVVQAYEAHAFRDVVAAEIVSKSSGIPITKKMIEHWKARYPYFRRRIEEAREANVDRIENAFFERALDPDRDDAFVSGREILRAYRKQYKPGMKIEAHITREEKYLLTIANMTEEDAQKSLERLVGHLLAERGREGSAGPSGSGAIEDVQYRLLEMGDGAGADDRRDAPASPPVSERRVLRGSDRHPMRPDRAADCPAEESPHAGDVDG